MDKNAVPPKSAADFSFRPRTRRDPEFARRQLAKALDCPLYTGRVYRKYEVM